MNSIHTGRSAVGTRTLTTTTSFVANPSAARKRMLFLAVLVGMCFGASAEAQNFGDLLVTPMRVVFEEGNRSQTLTVFNVGADTATYDISFINYRMNEDGTFTQIVDPDPGQEYSAPYLRFFPRSVTLAPKEAQNVRVQFRPAAGMRDGEYRSHLFFRSVPRDRDADAVDAADTTQLAIRVQAVFGLSIPVIVRTGELQAVVAVRNIAVAHRDDSARTPVLTLSLMREGTSSSYGDILVSWESAQGQTMQVAVVKGVAVYTPNTSRLMEVPLRFPEQHQMKGGKLRVQYINRSDLREKLLAEGELTVQ